MLKYLHPRVCFLVITLFIALTSDAQIVGERFKPQIDVKKYPMVKFEWKLPANLQVLMNEGLTYLDDENYALAKDKFTQVISKDSGFWPAFYYRGVASRVMGDHQDAKSDFLKCINFDDTNIAVYYLLAETNFLLGSFKAAETNFKKVIALDPSYARAYYGLGNVCFLRSDYATAERYYYRSTAIDPLFAPGFIMQGLLKINAGGKKNKAALELLDRGLAIDSLMSEGLFWRGLIYFDRKDYATCLKDWNKLVSAHPADPYYLLFRSFLHIELNDYDRAFNDAKKAVLMHQLDVNSYKASETKIDKHIELQNAAAYVARFSYGMNEHALMNFKRGFCYFVMGNATLSNEFLKEAEKIEPSATIYYMRAVNFDHDAKHDSAHVYYDKALRLDNEIIDAHKKRAIYRYQFDDWKGAYVDLNEILRLDPSLHVTYRIRGFIRAHQKDYVGAIVDLSAFLQSDSLDTEARTTRGYCRGKVNDIVGELEDYRQSMRIDPQNETLLNQLVTRYKIANDTTNLLSFHEEFAPFYPQSYSFRHMIIDYFIEKEDWRRALLAIQKSEISVSNEDRDDRDRKQLYSILSRYRGEINLKRGNYESASNDFTRALEFYQYNSEARFSRGKAYLSLGKRKEAIDDFQYLSTSFYPGAAEMLKAARKSPKK